MRRIREGRGFRRALVSNCLKSSPTSIGYRYAGAFCVHEANTKCVGAGENCTCYNPFLS